MPLARSPSYRAEALRAVREEGGLRIGIFLFERDAQLGHVWDDRSLDAFLADPIGTVPGTAMGYSGIPDPQERVDLIIYLREANRSKALCP